MASDSRSPSPRGRRRSPSPRDRGRSPSYSRSRSRSYSRSVSRRRSRSPSFSRSRSRGRSYSRRRSYSRSDSYSRSPPPRGRSPRRGRSPSPRSPPPYRRRSYGSPPRQRSPSPIPSRLVIHGLTRNVTPDHVKEIFSAYGKVVDIVFPINRNFNTNTGRAFVEFETVDEADKAICHMNKGQLDGQEITVDVAPPRPPRKFIGGGPIGRRRGGFRRDSFYGGRGRRFDGRSRRGPSPPRGRRYSRSRSPYGRGRQSYNDRRSPRRRSFSRSVSRGRSYSRSPVRR